MTWQALIDTSYTPPLVIGYGPFTEDEVSEIKAEVPEYDVVELGDEQYSVFVSSCCWAWLMPDNTLVVTPDDTPPGPPE